LVIVITLIAIDWPGNEEVLIVVVVVVVLAPGVAVVVVGGADDNDSVLDDMMPVMVPFPLGPADETGLGPSRITRPAKIRATTASIEIEIMYLRRRPPDCVVGILPTWTDPSPSTDPG
jgi:hypothetical protein